MYNKDNNDQMDVDIKTLARVVQTHGPKTN